jgi:hypothetical protein
MATVGVFLLRVRVDQLTGAGVSGDDVRVVARSTVTAGQDITINRETDGQGRTVVSWPPKDRPAQTLGVGEQAPGSPHELFKVFVPTGTNEVSFTTTVYFIEENIETIVQGLKAVGKFLLWTFALPVVPFLSVLVGMKETEQVIDGAVDEVLDLLGLRDRLMGQVQISVQNKKICVVPPPKLSGWFMPPLGTTLEDLRDSYTFENVFNGAGGQWTSQICIVRDCDDAGAGVGDEGQEENVSDDGG